MKRMLRHAGHGAHIRSETAKWAKVVKATGMKID